MASSTSSYYGVSSRLVRNARQWYGHAAGLFLLWTRLAAPWAAATGWVGGAHGGLSGQLRAMAVSLAVGPLAACLYAVGYMAVRQFPPVPLERLKALDTLVLAFAAVTSAVMAACFLPDGVSRLWPALPAAGLLVPAWLLNWRHEGSAAAPGSGELPPAPDFVPPVAGPVTAGYRSYDRSHTGVDFGVPEGTPVRAPAPGRVAHAGPLEQWGYAVCLDHGAGWTTLFAHLERPAVSRGQEISTGGVIGWSGTSGISTGPHLHAELRYNGVPVDPAAILPK